jgi:hypothetical protein
MQMARVHHYSRLQRLKEHKARRATTKLHAAASKRYKPIAITHGFTPFLLCLRDGA